MGSVRDQDDTPSIRRVTRGRVYGLGVYVNPDHYRYVALQLGPFWIYLWHEALR